MRKSFMRWLEKHQQKSLGADVAMQKINTKVQQIENKVVQKRRQELRIAEVSPVNPVYDRIKGRAL
jgi:hypothetical protein